MIRLAIFSPNENACTETFILQHREMLAGDVHYLYGGLIPLYANNGLKLSHDGLFNGIIFKMFGKIIHPKLNQRERAVYSYLRKNNINVVLVEYGHTGASIINVCKYLNIPMIVHFHGHEAYSVKLLKVFHKKYLEMFNYAATIIAVSNDMTEQLATLGCPLDKILYNPYGPDDQFYSLCNSFKKKNFLAVGRFVDKKAPYLTLDAFRKTLAEHADAHLIMVGDGPLLEACKNIVKSWGIEKSVHFKGALPQREIIKYFAQCIAFVQHSVTVSTGDKEGTPVAVLEAGAAGLPVIATKHAGIKDVVIDGVTGYLVDEIDTHSMSEKMNELAANPKLAAELGLAARKRINNNFNLNLHISNLNNVIVDAINQK